MSVVLVYSKGLGINANCTDFFFTFRQMFSLWILPEKNVLFFYIPCFWEVRRQHLNLILVDGWMAPLRFSKSWSLFKVNP